VLPDDAYLSLHLARSIAGGLGPWYGLAPTNGFQPLYVFVMAPVFAVVHDPLTPVRIALLLLVAADALALALTLRLALRWGCRPAAVLVAGVVWATAAWSLRTSLNGLETSLAAAAIAATLLAWDRVRTRGGGPAAWAALGALAGLACVARIDSAVLAPALAWPLLRERGDRRTGTLAPAAGLALAAACAAAVVAPWLAYSWAWTHTLFPVSGRAVRYLQLSAVAGAPTWANTYAPMLARAARAIARNAGAGLLVAAACACAAAAAGGAPAARRLGTRLRPLAPYATACALLVAAYAGWVFGPWYFARYFYPLWIAVVLAVALAADAVLDAAGPRRGAALAAVLAVVLVGAAVEPRARALFAPGPPASWGYLRAGEWARDHVAPGERIGSSQTGALGYFADRVTVVNLDGVVNAGAYAAMRRHDLLGYLRANRVEWLLWQDDIAMVARESRGAGPHALTYAGAPGVTTGGEPWRVWRVAPAGDSAARPR